MITKMVNHDLDKTNTKMKSGLVTDGAYDTNSNFRYFEINEFRPRIKERKNSIISIKNNKLRNREIRRQSKEDAEMEDGNKVRLQIDCKGKSLFNDKENVWQVCICYSVSKYGK